MTVENIKQLKKTHSRMTTVLNELEKLEYTEKEVMEMEEQGIEYDADYTEVKTDYRWIVQMLEHRRETLQKRGRTQ